MPDTKGRLTRTQVMFLFESIAIRDHYFQMRYKKYRKKEAEAVDAGNDERYINMYQRERIKARKDLELTRAMHTQMVSVFGSDPYRDFVMDTL